ncbi:DUF4167 domain-containing protein [Rhizobium leguminosarum]|uniref:DUF4167 domain-containing protein n=1 Tax=Rhizobium leguminosarum TaxID=384 RepID=A0AAJ1AA39_RHILE|nr:DUF4167 domain-containing protein [Rhizobium leguminosarum]MBY5535531.1 DUF4167 domain-containing protein [Rhizobium leguminosarum]MBY5596635.1 DUF4167 domain-containing protein [Rhizobium leguminosarum]MBY5616027.1 DUF4167 domain-containing protein [Rhizobium leguminosarum]MBY5629930.1 DUF4167 domain-containing protein [Rhizobium leguminosarum]MBY5731060.1 DUF4167 domain-containing protein [Rhizobium leguminosarum]
MNRPPSPNIRLKKTSANTGSQRSSRVAGNAKQHYEHYLALAREKALSGDRIEAENYYQHAEHYFRSAAAIEPAAQETNL